MCDYMCEGEAEWEKSEYAIGNTEDKKKNNIHIHVCAFAHFSMCVLAFLYGRARAGRPVIDSPFVSHERIIKGRHGDLEYN